MKNKHIEIEEQITKAYSGDDSGVWVVEKGKVKECRLLKQAVHRIDELKNKIYKMSDQHTHALVAAYESAEEEREKREEVDIELKELKTVISSFQDKISELKTVTSSFQDKVSELNNVVNVRVP